MADEKKFELGLSVSDEVVKDMVRTAVAKSLGNADAIVTNIINSAFESKSRESYGNKTVWQEVVEKTIRDRAQECFAEWMKQNDAKIKEAFAARLKKDRASVIAKIVDGLVSGMTQFGATVRLHVIDKDG